MMGLMIIWGVQQMICPGDVNRFTVLYCVCKGTTVHFSYSRMGDSNSAVRVCKTLSPLALLMG
jgi:hypothetical protein